MATVKIETVVVIEALEQALNKLHAEYAMQNSLEEAYQKECEAWKKEMIAFAIKNIDKATNFRSNYREWKDELNVDYDIVVPKGSVPESPNRQHDTINAREYRDTVADISKELRMLRMTKDEYVTASTLKSVGQYL
jgi:hypothetical protein